MSKVEVIRFFQLVVEVTILRRWRPSEHSLWNRADLQREELLVERRQDEHDWLRQHYSPRVRFEIHLLLLYAPCAAAISLKHEGRDISFALDLSRCHLRWRAPGCRKSSQVRRAREKGYVLSMQGVGVRPS